MSTAALPPGQPSPAAPAAATTGAAGRGGIAVLTAKVFFIVVGLAQQTLLPRAIGLAGYGAISRVMAMANVVNNVVVSSSLQGVSRAVAGAPGREDAALKAALRVHAPLAVLLAGAFALAAPGLAAFQKAEHIRWPLTVLAGVTLLYGVYAPLVGSLNGRKQFVKQAALDMSSATLRTTGILALGALWARRGAPGENGAALGAVLGAALVLPIAVRWARPFAPTDARAAAPFAPRDYLRVLIPLAGAQLFTNLLMQVDLTLLGRYLSASAQAMADASPAAGAGETSASVTSGSVAGASVTSIADEWVAVYRACQLFAFLPYQLLMSVTSVLFPMVARAHAEHDEAAVRQYVSRGMRIGVVACGLMLAVLVALPRHCLALAYGPLVAARGGDTLRVLALGQGAFALFGIATSVLTSLGGERAAATASLLATAAVAAACAVFVPQAPFGAEQLRTTATATAVSLGAALVGAGFLVRRRAGALVPFATVLRVAVAFGVTVLVGMRFPLRGPIFTVLAAAALGLVYALVLLASRELGKDDLASVRAIVQRRKS